MAIGHGLVKNFGSSAEPSSGRRLVAVACGSSHTVALTENNEIYSWGNGSHGQLGTGDCEIRWQPTRIDLFKDGEDLLSYQRIAGVCCGGRQTLAWLESGQACCFGLGQLGDAEHTSSVLPYASTMQKQSPRRPPRYYVFDVPKVQSIACGESHCIFLFQGGVLGACGLNSLGQLGTGDRISSRTVRTIDGITDIKTVACGAEHSFALAECGKLLVWGYGRAIGYEDGDVLTPTERVHHNTNILMMAGGRSHCMVLTETGNVYTWGSGSEGQLGHGAHVTYATVPRKVELAELQSTVVQVAAGDLYSAAVTKDGRLFMWGKNSHVIDANGDPGARMFSPKLVSTVVQRIRFVACGAWHAACIAADIDDIPTRLSASPQVADHVAASTVEDHAHLTRHAVALAGSSLAELGSRAPTSRLGNTEPEPSSSPPHFVEYQAASQQISEIDRLMDVHSANSAGADADAGSEECRPPDADDDSGQTFPARGESSGLHAASSSLDPSHTSSASPELLPQLFPTAHSGLAVAVSISPATIAWGASFDVDANPGAHSSADADAQQPLIPRPGRVKKPLATTNPPLMRPPLLRSGTMAFVQDKPTTLAPIQASSTLPGLLKRSATDLPDKLQHAGVVRSLVPDQQQTPPISDGGSWPRRAQENLATATADGQIASSKTIGFVSKHSLVPTRSSQQPAALPPILMQPQQQLQHRRETAEERLLREMKARHEALFMKEKALRRQLLPSGALQRLPLAAQGSLVAPQRHPGKPVAHDQAYEQVLKENSITSGDIHMWTGNEALHPAAAEVPTRPPLNKSMLNVLTSVQKIEAVLDDAVSKNITDMSMVSRPAHVVSSWTSRHHSIPYVPRNA